MAPAEKCSIDRMLLAMNPAARADSPGFWFETFKFFGAYTGGPMLLLSFAVAWATRAQRPDDAA